MVLCEWNRVWRYVQYQSSQKTAEPTSQHLQQLVSMSMINRYRQPSSRAHNRLWNPLFSSIHLQQLECPKYGGTSRCCSHGRLRTYPVSAAACIDDCGIIQKQNKSKCKLRRMGSMKLQSNFCPVYPSFQIRF